jgi:hypothetical protein
MGCRLKNGLYLLFVPVLVFFLPGLSFCGGLPAERPSGNLVGGPCDYKGYHGQARILSIIPIRSAGETGTAFEVRFSFQPANRVSEPFANPEGRLFLLTMKNGTFPDQRFLEKYRLETGRILEGRLLVITRGTCTPTLFEFTGIDLGDYGPR